MRGQAGAEGRTFVLRSGAALWRKFASRSPVAFDFARRTGSRPFPDLSTVAQRHGWFFPSVSGQSRRIRLSGLDQALFDRLPSEQWTRPLDLFDDGHFIRDHVLPLGDAAVMDRLFSWA